MFTQQPQSGSIEVQGNTKVLLCYANGIPPPVYRWKKDGRYNTPGNVTETSLKIQNIQRSEAGEYQCLASNTHGAILSNRVRVHIACKYMTTPVFYYLGTSCKVPLSSPRTWWTVGTWKWLISRVWVDFETLILDSELFKHQSTLYGWRYANIFRPLQHWNAHSFQVIYLTVPMLKPS